MFAPSISSRALRVELLLNSLAAARRVQVQPFTAARRASVEKCREGLGTRARGEWSGSKEKSHAENK